MKGSTIFVVLASLAGITFNLYSLYIIAPESTGIDPLIEGLHIYQMYFAPINLLIFFVGAFILAVYRFNIKQNLFLILPLILVILSYASFNESSFLKARRIFTPLKDKKELERQILYEHTPFPSIPMTDVYTAHYNYIAEKVSDRDASVDEIDCGILNIGTGLILPVKIYDEGGNLVKLNDVMGSILSATLRPELVDRPQFDTLYRLELPKGCFVQGGYGGPMIADHLIGVIPAIVHILPADYSPPPSTSSGSILHLE